MKNTHIAIALLILIFCQCQESPDKKPTPPQKMEVEVIDLNLAMANKLSSLAFHCIDTEYPNKLGQVIGGPEDLLTPKKLRPAFYGCFDWHSAVHGHWTLVKLLKTFPSLAKADSIRIKIDKNITPSNISTELAFWQGPHNKSFERTYGWAWLLKLQQELDNWDDPQGKKWAKNLKPLSDFLVLKYKEFLPKLNYPIRVGEHTNTAFGISFAIDYAKTLSDKEFYTFLSQKTVNTYKNDKNCPIDWEPSGYDFLSPCLQEAHLMSKVMDKVAFAEWWKSFVDSSRISKLAPATSLDLSDGKLVHLVGLNFSRAWCLFDIADALDDQSLKLKAEEHISASIDDVVNGDYAGEHWLASFAVMALTSNLRSG